MHIVIPVTGAILASRLQVQISAGLVDLKKCIKEATVRRNVVVQLIRMHRDVDHPDYQRCNMEDVIFKARELADTDEPTISDGLADILHEDSDDPGELCGQSSYSCKKDMKYRRFVQEHGEGTPNTHAVPEGFRRKQTHRGKSMFSV